MKRSSPKKILSVLCCFALALGAVSPALAAVEKAPLPGAPVAISGVALAGANFFTPSFGGAPSRMGLGDPIGLPVAGAPAPAAAPTSPAFALRAAAAESPKPPQDGASDDADKTDGALDAARDLSGRLSGGESGSANPAAASGRFFDRGAPADGEAQAVPTGSHGVPLNRLYPRVVFIQDVFSGPAPDSVVASVNRLIEAGVHVVFMTWRPQKGPGSAEEILLSRVKEPAAAEREISRIKAIADAIGTATMDVAAEEKGAFALTLTIDGQAREEALASLNAQMKSAGLPYKAEAHPDDARAVVVRVTPLLVKQSRDNPVIVASFNGGKIALHGRAANPQPILENVGQFSDQNIAAIKALADKIGAATLIAFPAPKEAFSLTLTIAGPARAAALKALNSKLRSAGLPYRAEAHPDDAGALIIHSAPLRFSLPRVLDALESQFPGENLSAQPEKFLVVADSMKSPRFSTSFNKLAEVQVARDGGGVDAVLSAVLGGPAPETVTIKLSKLRQYLEYWEPSRRYVSGVDSESFGGGRGAGSKAPSTDRQTRQTLAKFVGGVIGTLMAKQYENIRRSKHEFTSTPLAWQKELEATFWHPIERGVYLSKADAAALAAIPYRVKLSALEVASSYVWNFVSREFFSRTDRLTYQTMAANVIQNLVSLKTDIHSTILLEFKSRATGRIYKIHLRIPRVMRQLTAKGLRVSAHGYRTGTRNEESEIPLSRLYAMAILRKHGYKGDDGKWRYGWEEGEPIAEIVGGQFEYHDSPHLQFFDPSEFEVLEKNGLIEGPIVHEITSAIERMEADEEFQAYWKEHDVEATGDDLKKPAAKTKAKRKAQAKPKTVKRSPRNKRGR